MDLTVKNLSKQFVDFKLDNISFELPRGSVMGLIGPNGSGKTTTIKLILNMLKKNQGKIEILGYDNIKEEQIAKENLGIVFDSNYFVDEWNMKMVEKAMSRFYKTWNHLRFYSYIEQFKIAKSKKVKELSKGMQMKLMLACAFSYDSKLLILDEPTSGLDPVSRDELLEIIEKYVEDGKHSVLFSTHITSDLEKIADYITFIHQGRIILTESKDNLIYKYAILRCKEKQFENLDKSDILAYRRQDYQIDVLVNNKEAAERKYAGIVIDHATIDEIMLILVKGEQK